MKPCHRTRPSSPATSVNTYLKPGALAQIRYSKINARLKKVASQALTDLRQFESNLSLATGEEDAGNLALDGLPCFSFRVSKYPRCLQRKKLLAVTPFFSESLS